MIEDSPQPAQDSAPGASSRTPSRAVRSGLTARSLIIGLIATITVDLWVHWAELVLSSGGRGHTAVVNTAIPDGPFTMLFALAIVSMLCRQILPRWALTRNEMLVIYVMMTTSCVLSSSGQIHFIMPTVAAAWHYATVENAWATTFHQYVPHWMAQTNPQALDDFYLGNTTVKWRLWLPQLETWVGFMLALVAAMFFIVVILRKQWVEKEWLSFPTVQLPLAMMDPKADVLKNRLFWFGFILPFAVDIMNTVALNSPIVPQLNLRSNYDISQFFTTPPWNALGTTTASFYPFVIGIAYLAPTDITFSCWFFFWISRLERIVAQAVGYDVNNATRQGSFPYIGQQGAGAFLALTIISIWLARNELRGVVMAAFKKNSDIDESQEPITYRTAFLGLALAVTFLIGFCIHAGMRWFVAVIVVLLGMMYLIAAARLRAETGNPWLFGPDVDVNNLMTTTFGSQWLTSQDLTILAFLRPAIANFDMRCAPMPHQMDAFKMARETGTTARSVAGGIVVATLIGFIASICIALTLWTHFGAEVHTDTWRTSMGRVPFDALVNVMHNPIAPSMPAILAVFSGFGIMTALMFLRVRFLWWPFHPLGYAISATQTMGSMWLPFFLAWLFKVFALRYGGSNFYRKSVPFFFGLIAGDLLGGAVTTIIGCFTGISAYPVNW